MNLDEETERLLRLHPAVRAGVQPEYRQDYWQPQHAVPRRPAAPKPTDWEIESRVMADLAAIDRELDPQAPPAWTRNWYMSPSAWAMPNGKVLFEVEMDRFVMELTSVSTPSWVGYDLAAPAPPKQRTPKTYVAPGRKAWRTWIARLEQSKQARAKR